MHQRLPTFRLDSRAQLVQEPDETAWCQWMSDYANRCVARTELGMDHEVSTVFLGINLGSHAQPRYFETRVLGGPRNDDTTYTEGYHEASIVHDIVVEREKSSMAKRSRG